MNNYVNKTEAKYLINQFLFLPSTETLKPVKALVEENLKLVIVFN